MALIIFGIGFSLLALLLIWVAAKLLLRSGWLIAWIRGCTGFFSIAIAFLLVSMTIDLFSYSFVEGKQPLATVSISEKSPQLFDVELVDAEGALKRFELAGDQWQLDVRLLLLGGTASFKLDRISGRYLSLEQNDTDIRTAHAIWSESVSLIWLLVDGLIRSLPFATESIKQVAFVPMTDGAIFQVYLMDNELDVIPTNAQAKLVTQ